MTLRGAQQLWARNIWVRIGACLLLSLLILAAVSFLFGNFCGQNEEHCHGDYRSNNLAYVAVAMVFDALESYNALITAVATALLAVITYFLWNLEKQGDKTTQAQLRAYVFLDVVELARPDTPNGDDEPWYIHVVLKNWGATPAYVTLTESEGDLGVAAKPDNVLLNLSDNRVKHACTVIPPGQVHTIRKEGVNGLAQYLQIRHAQQRGYVWGRVEYDDAFGEPHWLTFQMVHVFGQVRQFGYMEAGNDSDRPLKSERP